MSVRRAGALQQFVSAVLADIVEGAQHAVPAADRDDAPALDAGGPVAARLAQHLLVAQILPAPAEDLLALGFEISRVDVAVRADGGGSCGDRVVAVARMLQLLSRQADRHADSHGPEVRGAAPIMPCPMRNTEEPRRNCRTACGHFPWNDSPFRRVGQPSTNHRMSVPKHHVQSLTYAVASHHASRRMP